MKSLNRYTLNTLLFMVVAGSSVESLADANYYRWVDDRGAAVHSDRPPPEGVDYEIISTNSNLIRTVSLENDAVPVNSKEASQSTKNPELCERATTNLETLTNSDKVKVRSDEGEVRFLSPEEIVVQRQTAKAQLSVYCD